MVFPHPKDSIRSWASSLTPRRSRDGDSSAIGLHEEGVETSRTAREAHKTRRNTTPAIHFFTRKGSQGKMADCEALRSEDQGYEGFESTSGTDNSTSQDNPAPFHLRGISQHASRLFHRATSRASTLTLGGGLAREGADRRPSAPTLGTLHPMRPATSWHQRAASFSFRPSSATFDSFNPNAAAAPGMSGAGPSDGDAAPSIPLSSKVSRPFSRSGPGAAARAAAAAAAAVVAASSSRSGNNLARVKVIRSDSKLDRDTESGICIDLRGSADGLGQSAEDTWPNSIVKRDPVQCLPIELASHILEFLDYTSLARAECVSRGWHHAASSHHVWRAVFLREHNTEAKWGQERRSSQTYDPTARGTGRKAPDQDWKDMMRMRSALRSKWAKGNLAAAYVEGHTDSVYCAQFDDDKFITGSRDRTVRIWDIHTMRTVKILGNPAVRDAVSNPDTGDLVPNASDAPLLHPIHSSPLPSPSNTMYHDASILCLQYDSHILVTGSSDATCIVYALPTYTPTMRLAHHTLGVLDVCIGPNLIVTCSKDTTLCVWSRATGVLLRQLHGHRGPVNAIQMRGNLVVSTSGDALIKLWNLTSGTCIREFAGHTRGLACVQFSLDARLIVSGGNDHVIRVWDANTGECLRELHGHRNLVRSLHLDSDNARVVSGSYDQSVKVWDLNSGKMLIDFPRWTSSWILCTKADYRRIVATSQCGRTFVMDFGKGIPGIEGLEEGGGGGDRRVAFGSSQSGSQSLVS